jgi:hypothetical protein
MSCENEDQNLLGCIAVFLTETSVDIQLRTWQYIPEDSELHTRRREKLKSHMSCEISGSHGGEYEV